MRLSTFTQKCEFNFFPSNECLQYSIINFVKAFCCSKLNTAVKIHMKCSLLEQRSCFYKLINIFFGDIHSISASGLGCPRVSQRPILCPRPHWLKTKCPIGKDNNIIHSFIAAIILPKEHLQDF